MRISIPAQHDLPSMIQGICVTPERPDQRITDPINTERLPIARANR